ncbi:hypothetical protein CTEN210_03579 [Chaetoceros tenuissimus]|uniref:Leucine-rich repeat domain-containing protein n=1 Tax=Chaetoceros tenuissimus TaxID=426638 RepID=A0AAD3H245_9STRA|nr:hypothetical protein CTEN210_03579 [Chaetoceros tenuissimus]
MRISESEWRNFTAGMRMFREKKTLFYNGEKLWEGDEWEGNPLIYDLEERDSWEIMIVLPGVEIIPEMSFSYCSKIKTVIMADSVQRIEDEAFMECCSLDFFRLSRNLEYIGEYAFLFCNSLTSIFIPPSCRQIGEEAFGWCAQLIILGLPQTTELGEGVFQKTKLMKNSPFELDQYGEYDLDDDDEAAIQWVKSINEEEANDLHRICSSFNPLSEIIYAIVKRQGIGAMKTKNKIGITPSQYLATNTFADITEKEITNRYILDMMGEVL